ncbi:MAG: ribonuclease P protein component [Pseudomonadota bacterium]
MPTIPLRTLKKRRDFLRLARSGAARMPGFVLQGRDRGDGQPVIRIGYTCSRKVGNAVTRNRAKRRLRSIARDMLPRLGRGGWDYVLIGRAGTTIARTFPQLLDDFSAAIARLHPAP